MTLNFQQSNALDLLEGKLARQREENAQLNERAQKNIEAISIILAIFSAFQAGQTAQPPRVIILLIFLVYIAVVFFSFYVQLSKSWREPLESDFGKFAQATSQPLDAYYNWITQASIESVRHNDTILRLKVRIVRISMLLVGLDILVIVGAAVLA